MGHDTRKTQQFGSCVTLSEVRAAVRLSADACTSCERVEHTIGVIKRAFGFQKVRYRGLAKNQHRLEVTAALANLYTVRRRLLRLTGNLVAH